MYALLSEILCVSIFPFELSASKLTLFQVNSSNKISNKNICNDFHAYLFHASLWTYREDEHEMNEKNLIFAQHLVGTMLTLTCLLLFIDWTFVRALILIIK